MKMIVFTLFTVSKICVTQYEDDFPCICILQVNYVYSMKSWTRLLFLYWHFVIMTLPFFFSFTQCKPSLMVITECEDDFKFIDYKNETGFMLFVCIISHTKFCT